MSTEWGRASRTATLPTSVHAPGLARDLLAEICERARLADGTTQTALLLTSEVVTNAVTHCEGDPVLTVEVEPDRMRVSVGDRSLARPQVVPAPARLSEHGRGMWLVDRLASRWGVDILDARQKVVWFELDRAAATPHPA